LVASKNPKRAVKLSEVRSGAARQIRCGWTNAEIHCRLDPARIRLDNNGRHGSGNHSDGRHISLRDISNAPRLNTLGA